MTLTFNRIARGHQATPDGRYAVVQDGYAPGYIVDPLALANGANRSEAADGYGGEWAAVYSPNGGLREDHNAGDNIDWFPTAREAKEACRAHARRTHS
jgi:hypothetical protein